MELIGIEALYPKPKLSQPGEGHKIYPYLLKGVEVKRVNQVWSTDITYIRMAQGFVYLVAVMDWFSRFVLSWALSLTMEVPISASRRWKARCRWGRPEIFNSDQGSQFTSREVHRRAGRTRTSPSAWMGAGAVWTTFSSSGCGVR